jgi:DNA-directed RNA polymerase
MSSIEAQLALEQGMLTRGAAGYSANLRKQEEGNRGGETTYAKRLIENYLYPLVEKLDEYLASRGAGNGGKARALIRRVASDKCMYIALRSVFNSFTIDEQVVQTASRIGRAIEDEARFSRFKELHGNYYDEIIKDFKRKGTVDYRFMHRVLTHQANVYNDKWESWTSAERVEVGVRLLDIVLKNTNLMTKTIIKSNGKSKTLLQPTDEAKEWVNQHEELSKLLFPDRSPCIIEPDKWTGLHQGGYYSPQLRSGTPMVKTSSKAQKIALAKADLTLVQDALNGVQSVEWEVNTDVLEIMRSVWAQNLGIGMPGSEKLAPDPSPVSKVQGRELTSAEIVLLDEWKLYATEVYTQEKERVSKSFQVTRIIRMANEYAQHSRFWYVWYADFRGRLYTATAGFSPQGPDVAKGLLRFAKGKALGVRGLYWLKVHIANRYGYDKVSYDDRVAWVDDQKAILLATAAAPLDHTHVWKDADKPWQFLAAVIDYSKALAAQAIGVDYVSRIPIGLDGSCNGLQHFSAMLRDEVGGLATNLVPADKPSDIYSEVARVCSTNLRLQNEDMSDWINFSAKYGGGTIPRSMAKRPVMTLPYGATRQSCTRYIHQSIIETDRTFFPANFAAAVALTPVLWNSIGQVVVAARDAMDWLQSSATVMNRGNEPIQWTTGDGFPVVQDMKKVETVQIDTQLQGRFQIRVGTKTDQLDKPAQRNGISPNFVHSQDGNHLRATVRKANERGIYSLAVIHDDYGTHAADTDALHECIREAFIEQYTDRDPLAEFKRQQEETGLELPDLPAYGSLDIQGVRDSRYFFG